VARKEYLDRLAALPPGPALTPEVWSEVHDEVQRQLVILETEVRRKLRGIRGAAGRTQGDRFFLFSYRTFSLPDSVLDPVVAGITFTPAGQSVTVVADVSGEGNGDMIFFVPSKMVADSREGLLEAARESARELCRSADVIAKALLDPARVVE
jgi:hypothetical protein